MSSNLISDLLLRKIVKEITLILLNDKNNSYMISFFEDTIDIWIS